MAERFFDNTELDSFDYIMSDLIDDYANELTIIESFDTLVEILDLREEIDKYDITKL